jgi:hypothetical protein
MGPASGRVGRSCPLLKDNPDRLVGVSYLFLKNARARHDIAKSRRWWKNLPKAMVR